MSGEGLCQRLVGATWPSRYLWARWKAGVKRSSLEISCSPISLSAHLVLRASSYWLTDSAHTPLECFYNQNTCGMTPRRTKIDWRKAGRPLIPLFRKECSGWKAKWLAELIRSSRASLLETHLTLGRHQSYFYTMTRWDKDMKTTQAPWKWLPGVPQLPYHLIITDLGACPGETKTYTHLESCTLNL